MNLLVAGAVVGTCVEHTREWVMAGQVLKLVVVVAHAFEVRHRAIHIRMERHTQIHHSQHTGRHGTLGIRALKVVVAHNETHHRQHRHHPAWALAQQNKHTRNVGVKPKHAQLIHGHVDQG